MINAKILAVAMTAFIVAFPAMADPAMQVSPSEQAKRDNVRGQILQKELDAENALLTQAKAEAAIAKASGADPAKLARLDEQLTMHNKNIEALNREIARAQNKPVASAPAQSKVARTQINQAPAAATAGSSLGTVDAFNTTGKQEWLIF